MSRPAISNASTATTRISIVFLGLTVSLALANWMISTPAKIQIGESNLHISDGVLGTTIVGLVALAGIACIQMLSHLSSVERELQKAALDNDFSRLKPVIGPCSVATGYNSLLKTAIGQTEASAPRAPAKLNEIAVTQARALRALATAWVITDQTGTIRALSPQARGILRLTASDDETIEEDVTPNPYHYSGNRSIFSALHLGPQSTATPEPDGPSKVERFLSGVRVVRLPIRLQHEDSAYHLQVTRSFLGGRDGDGQGFVWLLEDRTAAQNAIKSRDEFLLTAAHELRTPLSNLRACAETLRDEDQTDIEQQKEFCNIIVSESVRLGRLIDHLLSMGQIEAGSLVIEQRELDLHPILRQVEHQVVGQVEEKAQRLKLSWPDKLSTVHGDRDKLQATILNLVGNAVKYTPGGGNLEVNCHEANGWVFIDVIDDGPGIHEDEQDKVFDKFYRCVGGDHSQRGNGLGLAMAREVARLHGGEIDLDSKLGEGCRFSLRLPASGQAHSGIAGRGT